MYPPYTSLYVTTIIIIITIIVIIALRDSFPRHYYFHSSTPAGASASDRLPTVVARGVGTYSRGYSCAYSFSFFDLIYCYYYRQSAAVLWDETTASVDDTPRAAWAATRSAEESAVASIGRKYCTPPAITARPNDFFINIIIGSRRVADNNIVAQICLVPYYKGLMRFGETNSVEK